MRRTTFVMALAGILLGVFAITAVATTANSARLSRPLGADGTPRLKGSAALIVAAAFVTVTAGTGAASLANDYWTTRTCTQKVQKFLLPTTDPPGHNFYAAQAVCVGRGGQQTCQRSARGASRLYSTFTVFTRSVSGGVGVVRSFTLDTHSGHGVPAWGKSSEPPPFYVSHVKLIATNVSPARFRSTVRPIAARLRQHQKARGCARHAGG